MGGGDGLCGGMAALHLLRDEMRDYFSVGFRSELGALLLQLVAQLAKILDNAVVHDGEAISGMGMRVAFGGPAVGCPAGVPDSDAAFERLVGKPRFKIAQLTLGAAPSDLAALQRGHPGGVIAAVFEPLERIHKQGCDRLTSENAHNSAHA